MVWCHQVRWRVARAALEIGSATSVQDRASIFDRWLRDGHMLPSTVVPGSPLQLHEGDYEVIPSGRQLKIQNVHSFRTYIVSSPAVIEQGRPTKFVLYASQGTIPPVSPHRPVSYRATVHLCDDEGHDAFYCSSLPPATLKLIPSPVRGAHFPEADAGSDESEGVVLYEADIPASSLSTGKVVAVTLDNGDGRGWVLGGYATSKRTNVDAATLSK